VALASMHRIVDVRVFERVDILVVGVVEVLRPCRARPAAPWCALV